MNETGARSLRLGYGLAAASSFLGACLLWHVQPMMARFMLPQMGGSAAVWTTALVFYQSALVLGYAYAHWISQRGSHGLLIHGTFLLVAWLVFPISQTTVHGITDALSPSAQVLAWLALTIGFPYVLLSATAPLTQALSPEAHGSSPYRLFAWSNLGSIIGLLAYPFWVEAAFGLRQQSALWFSGFLLFAMLMTLTMFVHRSDTSQTHVDWSPALRDRLGWLGLSALGVALLMAVSDAVAADLTVTPVLWVLPLFAYLLSFVVCFGRPEWATRAIWCPATMIATAVTIWLLYAGWRVPWWLQLGLWCLVLFSGCMLFHGELVRRRPPAPQLTRYYLDISIGGALSGICVGILAPAWLPLRIEIHLITALGFLLAAMYWLKMRRESRPFEAQDLALGLCILAGLCLLGGLGFDLWKTVRGDTSLYRSFYGTLKVKRYPIPRSKGGLIHLLDGRISHGFQFRGAEYQSQPTSYFVHRSGVGRVLTQLSEPKKVLILGLGVGTLSTYARPGDHFEFYEINPDVITAARRDFTYLQQAGDSVTVRLGDGRLLVADVATDSVDVIVVDAFTGDAIPAHLITVEALDLYWARLKESGFLAINVSNRHADLWRVIHAYARLRGFTCARVRHTDPSPLGSYTSDWMLMARSPERLDGIGLERATGEPSEDVLWTDDYAPLFPILRGL